MSLTGQIVSASRWRTSSVGLARVPGASNLPHPHGNCSFVLLPLWPTARSLLAAPVVWRPCERNAPKYPRQLLTRSQAAPEPSGASPACSSQASFAAPVVLTGWVSDFPAPRAVAVAVPTSCRPDDRASCPTVFPSRPRSPHATRRCEAGPEAPQASIRPPGCDPEPFGFAGTQTARGSTLLAHPSSLCFRLGSRRGGRKRLRCVFAAFDTRGANW